MHKNLFIYYELVKKFARMENDFLPPCTRNHRHNTKNKRAWAAKNRSPCSLMFITYLDSSVVLEFSAFSVFFSVNARSSFIFTSTREKPFLTFGVSMCTFSLPFVSVTANTFFLLAFSSFRTFFSRSLRGTSKNYAKISSI